MQIWSAGGLSNLLFLFLPSLNRGCRLANLGESKNLCLWLLGVVAPFWQMGAAITQDVILGHFCRCSPPGKQVQVCMGGQEDDRSFFPEMKTTSRKAHKSLTPNSTSRVSLGVCGEQSLRRVEDRLRDSTQHKGPMITFQEGHISTVISGGQL